MAAAPYAGAILVGIVVMVLRAGSIGRERHHRRRAVRGGARWFDVPTTAMSSPGYLALAFLGTLLAVGWACAAAVAFGVVEYLLHPPLPLGLVLAGGVFTLALWWGPGSGRLRTTVVGAATRASRRENAGVLLAATALLLAVVLLGFLVGNGPTWSPAPGAPWDGGFLGQVRTSI